MKRILSVGLLIFVMLFLCSCGENVSEVKISSVDSDIYSQNDIDSAINTAINYFKWNFNGCKLIEIHYAGDEYADEFKEWAKQYDADEAIMLLSDFYVNSTGGDGSLEPDSTQSGWNWILVRNKNGSWEHKDHGY